MYILGVGCITVAYRLLLIMFGLRAFDHVPQLSLLPFWSYAEFEHADIRWQVYMNVFLFIDAFGKRAYECGFDYIRFLNGKEDE